jgi:hypothetical protein
LNLARGSPRRAGVAPGWDIGEIAVSRSAGTLRAQLRSIFAQTSVHRPSELLALVVRYSRRANQGLE